MGQTGDQEDSVGTRRTEICPSAACHGAKEGGEFFNKRCWNISAFISRKDQELNFMPHRSKYTSKQFLEGKNWSQYLQPVMQEIPKT